MLKESLQKTHSPVLDELNTCDHLNWIKMVGNDARDWYHPALNYMQTAQLKKRTRCIHIIKWQIEFNRRDSMNLLMEYKFIRSQ